MVASLRTHKLHTIILNRDGRAGFVNRCVFQRWRFALCLLCGQGIINYIHRLFTQNNERPKSMGGRDGCLFNHAIYIGLLWCDMSPMRKQS